VDNVPYKICFAIGHGLTKEKKVILNYTDSKIDINNIDSISDEIIK
jgi:hypothetical protein